MATPAALDANTRLAYERTYLAYERTQMGWIRTALTFISFGFSIAKFFELLRTGQPGQARLVDARALGLTMIGCGLIALLLADLQHRRAMKRLHAEYPALPRSVAGITAAFIALLGIIALLGALFFHN